MGYRLGNPEADLGGRLGEDRVAGRAGKGPYRVGQIVVGVAWPADDHAAGAGGDLAGGLVQGSVVRGQPGRRDPRCRPVAQGRQGGVRARERLAVGHVQMHRPARRTERARAGERGDGAQVAQARLERLGSAEVGEEAHVGAEEVLLVHRLRRAESMQLQRAVGGERDERHAGGLRLEDGRKEVRAGRSGGREGESGTPRRLCRAESDEGGAALVEHHAQLHPLLLGAGEDERSGPRARTDDGLARSGRAKLVDQRARKERVEVVGFLQPVTPSAERSAWAFSSVSAHSPSAVEPATMPAPTYNRAEGPRKRAQRSATARSARRGPHRPTMPA